MNLTLRNHLTALDRTLLQLLNERARLVNEIAEDGTVAQAAIEDLLARSSGDFPAEHLRAVFAALDEASTTLAGVQS